MTDFKIKFVPMNQAVEFLLNGQLPTNNIRTLRGRFYKSEEPKDADVTRCIDLIKTWNINQQLEIRGIESVISFNNDGCDGCSYTATIHLCKDKDKQNWFELFKKEFNVSDEDTLEYVKENPGNSYILKQNLQNVLDDEDPNDWILLSYPSGIDENYVRDEIQISDMVDCDIKWKQNIMCDEYRIDLDGYNGYSFVEVNFEQLQELKSRCWVGVEKSKKNAKIRKFVRDAQKALVSAGYEHCEFPDVMEAIYDYFGVSELTHGYSRSQLRGILNEGRKDGNTFYIPAKQGNFPYKDKIPVFDIYKNQYVK